MEYAVELLSPQQRFFLMSFELLDHPLGGELSMARAAVLMTPLEGETIITPALYPLRNALLAVALIAKSVLR